MKKFVLAILSIFLAVTPVFSKTLNATGVASVNTTPIDDELLSKAQFYEVTPIYIRNETKIEDEFIEEINRINSNDGTIQLEISKNDFLKKLIEDELLTEDFVNKNSGNIIIGKNNLKRIEDEFAQKAIDITKLTIIKAKNCYNFAKTQIPVHLRIAEKMKFKKDVKIGDELKFITTEEVKIGEIKLPAETEVIGKIETISASDKMGVPESVVVDNFYVKNKPDINFFGYVSKTGANRSIWVYPLYQAGNITFYVAGFIFVPIHGGRAKFSPDDIYTVYYEAKE